MIRLRVLEVIVGCLLAVVLDATSHAQQDEVATWSLVTNDAGWLARDSCGELVYKDQLWIFGGWFNSYEAPPRDVWSSADGRSWSQVTQAAPWIHSDLPMTLTFQDRMWLMGGWFNGRLPGHSATNSVWSSTNGMDWRRDAVHANWTPRLAAASVVFKGRMWILGGTENYYFGDAGSLKNDVWSSIDGQRWELATDAAAWKPRAYHQAVVLNGRMYVMGGGNYVPEYEAFNDVWSSDDGVNWRQETAAAPWHSRLWFSAVTYRDHIWVLGGWSNKPSTNWGDAWFSKDGRTWRKFKSNVTWKERHEHSAFVFQDRIWVAGGHAQPLSNEVWSLQLPADWGGLPQQSDSTNQE